jgi:transcription-repair coupling factor (superfamily II helicase)
MNANLAGLLPLLRNNKEFQRVCAELEAVASKTSVATTQVQATSTMTMSGIPAAARPYFLATLQSCSGRPLLVVTARPAQARLLAEQVAVYSEQPDLVLHWRTPDTLPYERIAQDPTIISERLETLAALQRLQPGQDNHLLIIASAKGLMQPTLSKADFQQAMFSLQRGQQLDLNRTLAQLVRLGYNAESAVEEAGQFSRRGGIIDLWPMSDALPVRIELFGTDIDSLRTFDPVTQRSLQQVEQITIVPPVEVPLWRSSEALGRLEQADISSLRQEVQEEWQRLLNRIENGETFEGIEQFIPYYTDTQALCSLVDHLPSMAAIILDGDNQISFAVEELSAAAEKLREQFETQGEVPPALLRPYLTWQELSQSLHRYPCMLMERINEEDDRIKDGSTPVTPPVNVSTNMFDLSDIFASSSEYVNNIGKLLQDVETFLDQKQRLIIVSQQAERLREQFEDHDLFPIMRKEGQQNLLAAQPSPGSFNLVTGALGAGWRAPELGVVLVTDREIFGWQQQGVWQAQRSTKREVGPARTQQQRDAFLRDLKPGDYVVHIEHGIARFEGLVKIKPDPSYDENGRIVEAPEREYLYLKYAEADRLYVPIDQVDRVLPYTAPGQVTPTLHKLGSVEWTRTKRKVRSAIEDIAKELIELYSARQLKAGHAFASDNIWQREMEEAFPYNETPDQLRAIFDVKGDMERPRPMDRLICGDVGYGKTEVALRAAFKAVMDGKQVAMLAPTTILVQQHWQTFTQRLKAFPAVIETLSRFRTKREQTDVLERLVAGKVDILIGTHRLLQKDVLFKDLGLLVIDEEQRFGVKHKERLKQMKQEVDVLTLSATPIPRTLHMSLVGVRDMSIIETPPAERLPVKTYVTAYSEQLVREVILRELERGGQVFFVHNRVQSIAQVAGQLKLLVPEARVLVGHGQMEEGELEKVMTAFTHHEADVLVCTTIIESGLDIPNANTLIIDNAIMYGLAQLYQLRGRVGRSNNRAYAYFLYKPGSTMTEDAQKRLDTMLETQELGAGFKIAMKDLEIRGAGNLLGAEQSGQIAAVGFELYVRLLEEAVEQQRGAEERPLEAQVEAPTVNLALPLSAFLPEDYIEDQAIRLDMYRKLAAPMQTAAHVREIVRELEDRFGALPDPVRNLMYLLDIKVLAIRAGIESIVEQSGEIFLRWPAPSVETEMRRKSGPKHVEPPTRPKATGRANVDVRRLMQVFGEALRITPNQMRLNTTTLPKNASWQDKLKQLLEELVM